MTPLKPEHDNADVAPDSTVSRRLLLRRSLGVATPVVMTLASLPSHAAAVCVNPSGFISPATFNSRHPGGMVCTVRRGPSYFASLPLTSWPSADLFAEVFGAPPPGGDLVTTLKQVLGGNYDFAKYCVAAYANASAPNPPLNFPITLAQSRALFKTITLGSPPAGLAPFPSFTWTELQALEWLRTVMNA